MLDLPRTYRSSTQVCHIHRCQGISSHTAQLICAHAAVICLGLLYIQKPQAYGQCAHKRDTSRENLTYFKPRHVGCASEAVSWNTKSLDEECIWSKFCNKKIKRERERLREREPNYSKLLLWGYVWKTTLTENCGNKASVWKKGLYFRWRKPWYYQHTLLKCMPDDC